MSLKNTVLITFAVGSVLGWILADRTNRKSLDQTVGHSAASEKPTTVDQPEQPLQPQEDRAFANRLESMLTTRSKQRRARAVAGIGDDLDARQIRAALQTMERTHIPEREAVLMALFSRWGEIEPQAALAYASETRDEYVHRAVVEIMKGWARTDFDAALEAAGRIDGTEVKKNALTGVLHVLSESDPRRAFKLAEETRMLSEVATTLFKNWAESNPEEAATHAVQMAGHERFRAMEALTRIWAEIDRAGAMRWSESLPDNLAIAPLIWIFSKWADEDGNAAAQWLEEMPVGARRTEILDRLSVEAGVRFQDARVFERFVALLPPGPRRNNSWNGFLESRSNEDLSEALALAQTQPPEVQDVTIPNLARQLVIDDPGTALKLASSLGEGVRDEAVGEVLQWWAREDPVAAADWVRGQTPKAEYLKGVAVPFINKDLAGATEWINTIAAGRIKDDVIDDVVEKLQQRNPQIAASWIEGISDENKRETAYHMLAQVWLDYDPAAARAWLASAPMPDGLKKKLLGGAEK